MVIPELELPPGEYPFIDQRYPLSELAMIEAPRELAELLSRQAEINGDPITRNQVVTLTARTEQFGDATFVVWWPERQPMHMLVPKKFRSGNA